MPGFRHSAQDPRPAPQTATPRRQPGLSLQAGKTPGLSSFTSPPPTHPPPTPGPPSHLPDPTRPSKHVRHHKYVCWTQSSGPFPDLPGCEGDIGGCGRRRSGRQGGGGGDGASRDEGMAWVSLCGEGVPRLPVFVKMQSCPLRAVNFARCNLHLSETASDIKKI